MTTGSSALPGPQSGGADASVPRRKSRYSLLTRRDKLTLALMVGIPLTALLLFVTLLRKNSDCPGEPYAAASGTNVPRVVVPLPSQSPTTGFHDGAPKVWVMCAGPVVLLLRK